MDEKIGSFAKEFGLSYYPTVKNDLTTMVKSHSEAVYNAALCRLRATVQNNNKITDYVECNIHAKRHLFANHLINKYPANLHRQGNVPAECNHASMLRRLEDLMTSPVELVESLLGRHRDISYERNRVIRAHHYSCIAEAQKIQDPAMKAAILNLDSWGYEYFNKSVAHSAKLEHTILPDRSNKFNVLGEPDSSSVILEPGANVCSCYRCVALNGGQCAHLYLSKGGFSLECWNVRWHQRSELGTSLEPGGDGIVSGTNANDTFAIKPFVEDNAHRFDDSNDDDQCDFVAGAGLSQGLSQTSVKFSLRDIYEMTKDLAHHMSKVKSTTHKKKLLGAIVKLTEIAKGNIDDLDEQSLDAAIENRLNLFSRSIVRPFPQQDKENVGMIQASLPDYSRKRLKSANEHTLSGMTGMTDSNKRKALCTLCLLPGHQVGTRCPLVCALLAVVIKHQDSGAWASKLGYPVHVLVEQPDDSTRHYLTDHVPVDQSAPSQAQHIVIKRCLSSARPSEGYQHNLVELSVLEAGGTPMEGHKICYIPVHNVANWIAKKARTKHLLSCLKPPSVVMSQELCQYSSPKGYAI